MSFFIGILTFAGFRWVDASSAPPFGGPLKLNVAFYKGEKGEIPAKTNVPAGQNVSTSLTHNHVANSHAFSIVPLDSQPLRFAIPTVSRAATCLLMSH
jgi:hypothetical protein